MPVTPERLWIIIAALVVFTIGMVVGAVLQDNTTAKVDLAPNGMAYCPADSSTPHPTPCMFRQP